MHQLMATWRGLSLQRESGVCEILTSEVPRVTIVWRPLRLEPSKLSGFDLLASESFSFQTSNSQKPVMLTGSRQMAQLRCVKGSAGVTPGFPTMKDCALRTSQVGLLLGSYCDE